MKAKRLILVFAAVTAVTLFIPYVHDTLKAQTKLRKPISSVLEWEAAYLASYGTGVADLDRLRPGTRWLHWNGPYWMHAYTTMAQITGDPTYMAKAQRFIDKTLSLTDDKVGRPSYRDAPPYYKHFKDIPAPGWNLKGAINYADGEVTWGIMKFVDLAYSDDRFTEFRGKASEYMDRVEKIVRQLDSAWLWTPKNEQVPGSYYYTKDSCKTPDWSSCLHSGPRAFNQNVYPIISMLLIDRVKRKIGQTPDPEYRKRAQAMVDYFKAYAWESDGAFQWKYALHGPRWGNHSESLSHGHVDVGFLFLSYKFGLDNINRSDMVKLARAVTRKIYKGDGELSQSVDGMSGFRGRRASIKYDWVKVFIAMGWLDLAEFDKRVFDIATEVYEKNYSIPVDSARHYAGWANILKWDRILRGELPYPYAGLRSELSN